MTNQFMRAIKSSSNYARIKQILTIFRIEIRDPIDRKYKTQVYVPTGLIMMPWQDLCIITSRMSKARALMPPFNIKILTTNKCA
jgi:hypothetical protein